MVPRTSLKMTSAAVALFSAMLVWIATPAVADTSLYGINAGGPLVAGAPSWAEDSQIAPSTYVNAIDTKNLVSSTNAAIDVSDPSVPAGTPAAIFRTGRWDPIGRAELQWSFPAPPGRYQVKLYFAESYPPNFAVGKRVFDVLVENQVALDHYDIFAAASAGNRGVVATIPTVSDGTLNINFRHQIGDPLVSAVEIISPSAGPPPAGTLSAAPTSLGFGAVMTGSSSTLGVQLTNSAAAGSGSVVVASTTMAGTDAAQFSDSFDDTTAVTLAPGQSTTVDVRFAPTSTGGKSASLQLAHNGPGSPLAVPLSGEGQDPSPPAATGTWVTGAPMPRDLGEVSVGIIGTRLYLVGQDDNRTLAYNLINGTWEQKTGGIVLAQRPFLGNHHAAEVINGQLYLFGGVSFGAGKVQIYNPATNSWRLGADIPIASGSAATALIGGKVYYAGGESQSTTQAAVYDPVADSWSMIAPMPRGVTHAAAGTDGQKLWVFGGRGGAGGTSGTGTASNLVQFYDPATGTWESSGLGSMLAPFPVARGGTGKAVYSSGRFYIMGGEDLANVGGATSTGAYNRVDIYNVATNSWSTGTPMPTARHGIFPALYQGKIYVAAGGIKALHSSSTILEIYTPGS